MRAHHDQVALRFGSDLEDGRDGGAEFDPVLHSDASRGHQVPAQLLSQFGPDDAGSGGSTVLASVPSWGEAAACNAITRPPWSLASEHASSNARSDAGEKSVGCKMT